MSGSLDLEVTHRGENKKVIHVENGSKVDREKRCGLNDGENRKKNSLL